MPSFGRVALHLATVDPGARFGRIVLNRHTDPLGFAKPLKVCFLEAVLRDSRNGAVGDYPMDERELHVRRYADRNRRATFSLRPTWR